MPIEAEPPPGVIRPVKSAEKSAVIVAREIKLHINPNAGLNSRLGLMYASAVSQGYCRPTRLNQADSDVTATPCINRQKYL